VPGRSAWRAGVAVALVVAAACAWLLVGTPDAPSPQRAAAVAAPSAPPSPDARVAAEAREVPTTAEQWRAVK